MNTPLSRWELAAETMPWDDPVEPVMELVDDSGAAVEDSEIPICRLDETPFPEASNLLEFPFTKAPKAREGHAKVPTLYRLPSTELLNQIPVRSVHEYAARGELPSVRIGRHRRFSRAAVEAVVERG